VISAEKESPDLTKQPASKRFLGYQVAVVVDDCENIDEVERQLPSQLDGFSIVVGCAVAL
jgi:hypothetical protein